jgi:hypothetical protein
MSCNTKDASLIYLKDKKFITEDRVIIGADLASFDVVNTMLTARAKEIYGLDIGDRKIYDVEKVSRTVKGNDARYARDQTFYLATPVDDFFTTLDELYNIRNTNFVDFIRKILSRKQEPRIAYIGKHFKGTNANHFTQNEMQTVSVKKKVSINTTGFLNQVTDKAFFDKLVADFELRKGVKFNINDKSALGRINQEKFFAFLAKYRLKGIELYDSGNNLQLIAFNYPVSLDVENNILEDIPTSFNITTTISPTTEPIIRSVIEKPGGYYISEANRIYEVYSPEVVNQMMEENSENAKLIFNTLIYPNEFKNDIFVTDSEVNDHIRKCK